MQLRENTYFLIRRKIPIFNWVVVNKLIKHYNLIIKNHLSATQTFGYLCLAYYIAHKQEMT